MKDPVIIGEIVVVFPDEMRPGKWFSTFRADIFLGGLSKIYEQAAETDY